MNSIVYFLIVVTLLLLCGMIFLIRKRKKLSAGVLALLLFGASFLIFMIAVFILCLGFFLHGCRDKL